MSERNLPASRSLLDRPQRLGVLPTLWFWNDGRRQWLLTPLFALTAPPLVWGLDTLVRWLGLSSWLVIGFTVLYPTVVMGLIERHIRRELRLRAPEARLVEVGVPFDRRMQALLAALAVLSAVLAVAVTVGVGADLSFIALTCFSVILAVALLPRVRPGIRRLVASAHGGPLELPGGRGD